MFNDKKSDLVVILNQKTKAIGMKLIPNDYNEPRTRSIRKNITKTVDF
jgi:hypothetical protein